MHRMLDFSILGKFCLVGLTGVLVNFLVTYFLKEKLKSNPYWSNALGFISGVSVNYVLNRYWTFTSDQAFISELRKFALVIAIGLLLNHMVVYFCHRTFKINFYLSKVLAVGIVFLWNFTAHSIFTFNH